MNLVAFALRRPVSLLMVIVAIMLGGLLALDRMPRDIFPDLGVPTIYVAQPYGGMDPAQMEGFIVNYYEYHFLYITGIEHVESKSIQGAALIKLQFHPGTDMAQAMAETVGYVNRARAFMPPGTVPPFVMRFDAGSVPVGNLVFSSETRTVAEDAGRGAEQGAAAVRDAARRLGAAAVRRQARAPSSSTPIRTSCAPTTCRPTRSSRALRSGNTISPSGQHAHRRSDADGAGQLRRLGHQGPRRRADPRRRARRPFSCATSGRSRIRRHPDRLRAGQRPPHGLHPGDQARRRLDARGGRAGARQNSPRFQAVLPDDIKVSYEFDQSPYVTRAIGGLAMEGVLGAVLTGLMVLLFLRDWRSAVVVVLNIPLALLAAAICAVGLRPDDQHHDARRTGAGGRHPGRRGDGRDREHPHASWPRRQPRRARRVDATPKTTVPRLLAMLCILAVFIPAFFMSGAARSLFVPLALAVGFSMVASYLLSSTLVPVLAVWLLRAASAHGPRARRFFDRLRRGYGRVRVGAHRAALDRAFCRISHSRCGRHPLRRRSARHGDLPRASTPDSSSCACARQPARASSGRSRSHCRRSTSIKREVGPDNVEITLGFVGVQPPTYPDQHDLSLDRADRRKRVLQVQLKRNAGISVEALKERLRKTLAEKLPGVRFSFEPSDIVSQRDELRSANADRGRGQRSEHRGRSRVRRKVRGDARASARRCATCSSSRSSTIRP